MHCDDLVAEKWKTQRKMAAVANYSVKKMLDNAEKIVEEMIKEHGVTLKYAIRKPSLPSNILMSRKTKKAS
jgi:hypothetical protein